MGPGDSLFTQQQFAALPSPRRILDMGCGRGAATLALAQVTDATIVAIDLDEEALAAVARSASAAGLNQVTTLCANMAALPADLAPPISSGLKVPTPSGWPTPCKHGGRTLPALLPAWC